MEYPEDLKRILDNDEEILKAYKPNKKRFILINLCFSCLFMMIVPFVLLLIGILGLAGVITFTTESGAKDAFAPTMLMTFGGIAFLFLLINCISLFVRYSKAYYFLSNKRIIIRNGFIGADYRSLQFSSIGMVDVRVDFLDKLVKNNTGTIVFGSSSAPIINGNQQQRPLGFYHIDNPYDAYKEIKEIIFQNNENQKQS